MRVEDQYEDVLQNIEFAIANVYRAHSEMLDADALSAVEWLLRLYSAEAKGRASAAPLPAGLAGEAAHAAQAMCEWRLGREALTTAEGEELPMQPITLPEMVLCLKHIRKSIQFWSKERGRRGYLDFVEPFVR